LTWAISRKFDGRTLLKEKATQPYTWLSILGVFTPNPPSIFESFLETIERICKYE